MLSTRDARFTCKRAQNGVQCSVSFGLEMVLGLSDLVVVSDCSTVCINVRDVVVLELDVLSTSSDQKLLWDA